MNQFKKVIHTQLNDIIKQYSIYQCGKLSFLFSYQWLLNESEKIIIGMYHRN